MGGLRRTAVIALLTVLTEAPAGAFVRYRTDQGRPFYWAVSCVPVTVYLNGFTQIPPNEVAKSVAAAAHTWSPDWVTCGSGAATTHPYLEVVPSLSVDPTALPRAAYDARNSLIFRTDSWSMSGAGVKVYSDLALAITSVFAKPDGHIVDADIEVNAVTQELINQDPDAQVVLGHGLGGYDLQTILTHEFGHFIGLDHTCFSGFVDPTMAKPRPKDDMGNDVPDCFDAPQAIRDTVMFDSASAGDTTKRFLTADDTRGVCAIYPPDLDPQICAMDLPNDGVGCATAQRAGKRPVRGLLLAALLGALGLAWRAARRRRA